MEDTLPRTSWRAKAIPPAQSSSERKRRLPTLQQHTEMLVASCCRVLEHSWLTRLFFKASDSHSGLFRADLTSEPSCSVPFLSWDAHREIFPYANKQQNQVWHQLPFHISLLMVVWLCQPSPMWKGPCPFTTNTST